MKVYPSSTLTRVVGDTWHWKVDASGPVRLPEPYLGGLRLGEFLVLRHKVYAELTGKTEEGPTEATVS